MHSPAFGRRNPPFYLTPGERFARKEEPVKKKKVDPRLKVIEKIKVGDVGYIASASPHEHQQNDRN